MERLTTNDPQGNVETAHNLFYAKDTEAWVRGGGAAPDYADITLYDFIRQIVQNLGPMSIDTSVPDEELGEELCELLFDGTGTIEGLVATLYTAAWAFADLRKRLAAYEDTGLTPGQVSVLQTHPDHAYADYVRTLWHDIGGMERMEAVAKAERENRLVVPPCKVGDTLYEIDLPEYGVIVCKVMWMILKNDVSVQVEVTDGHGLGSGYCFELSDFGRTVFHTREAAEAALKEREGT